MTKRITYEELTKNSATINYINTQLSSENKKVDDNSYWLLISGALMLVSIIMLFVNVMFATVLKAYF